MRYWIFVLALTTLTAQAKMLPTCEDFESTGTFVQPEDAAIAGRFPRLLFERTILSTKVVSEDHDAYEIDVKLAKPLTNVSGIAKMVIAGQDVCFTVLPSPTQPYLKPTDTLRFRYVLKGAGPAPKDLFNAVPQLVVIHAK